MATQTRGDIYFLDGPGCPREHMPAIRTCPHTGQTLRGPFRAISVLHAPILGNVISQLC